MFKEYYQRYWEQGGQIQSQYQDFKRQILGDFSFRNNKILDIGGGDGYTSEILLQDNQVYLSDISLLPLKKAHPGFMKVQYDVQQIPPFKDQSFDVILCLDVLEHVLDPELMLARYLSLLREGGLFVVSVPNMLNFASRILFLCGQYFDFTDVHCTRGEPFPEHIRVFSKKVLEDLLSRIHLRIRAKIFYIHQRPEGNSSKYPFSFVVFRIINKLKLHKLFPALFAIHFIYVCEK